MDKGYYPFFFKETVTSTIVAIHNKNGQGLLREALDDRRFTEQTSQSTIKMDKGYYKISENLRDELNKVAIHNKNGQGLLLKEVAQ